MDDIATGAIGSVLSMLAELAKAEYKLQTGVKKEVESLAEELKHIYAFLQKIAEVPPDQLDEQVKLWAYQVREASYDMEDVLDAFLVRFKGQQTTRKRKLDWLDWLQEAMGSFFSKVKARHDIGNAIEDVNKKLREIAERRQRYKLDDLVATPAEPSSSIDPRIALVHGTKASLLIGIDKRKDAVVKMLSHDDGMSAKKTKVVSLLGFGGVGKTTLAKAIYDQLKQEFQCGAFVSVGQKPNFVKVFKDILYDLDSNKYDAIHSTQRGADFLIPELLDFSGDKRYLIVIDDVWETKSRKTIVKALTDNDIGSRIIITTRKSNVAIGEVYRVQPLSDDNSKKLFYTRIFGGEDKCPANQQEKVSQVEDKILKKCGGVPLAIITMASLLVGKSMEEWSVVCNSIGLQDKDKEQTEDVMWILSLSYHDLPSHLKTCLLYLSVFPEDYFIQKDALIWMWIGEGFINNAKVGIGLFEIGEGYFNELINRSLIQPVDDWYSMIVDGCCVHDMVLDLIRSLSREANFATVLGNGVEVLIESNARRLALHNRVEEDNPHDNHTDDKTRARSLVAFGCSFGSWARLQSFKLLRVLYLYRCSCVPFHEHVGNLNHLRCLGIHYARDLEHLKELGALKFLQVLELQGNSGNGILPSSVGMLTQLVCLRAFGMGLPSGTTKELTSLQELQLYDTRNDAKAMGQFVKDLGNLLELRALRTDISSMDERMRSDFSMSLGNLHKLQRLRLYSKEIQTEATAWYKGLALLPRQLCQLNIPIAGYVLPPCIDPSRLPNLTHLTLEMESIDDQGLEIMGGLPELRYLFLIILKNHRATLTSTAAHVYFQKLRSCLLQKSTVYFVVNKEDSSVSFDCMDDPHPPALDSKKEQDSCRVALAVMPNLEALRFQISVKELTARKNGSCDNLGLECLASLQKVRVNLRCWDAPADVVQKEEAALRHAIQVHPNQPALEIKHCG